MTIQERGVILPGAVFFIPSPSLKVENIFDISAHLKHKPVFEKKTYQSMPFRNYTLWSWLW
jgi:hypothetical protein